ncbi:MAG: hypothetical protein JNM46_01235 [Anaerolineales bacterium]|nr:hypothetical protein [Anaerolineales bacterium]
MNNYISELEQAVKAREQGKEGQARVCARRAAGLAIKDYLTRKGIHPPSVSALDLLNYIKEETLLPADLKLVTEHLTLRVTEEFKLPIEADLIAESRQLCEWLVKN